MDTRRAASPRDRETQGTQDPLVPEIERKGGGGTQDGPLVPEIEREGVTQDGPLGPRDRETQGTQDPLVPEIERKGGGGGHKTDR